jgi:hypothetical protein
MTLNQAHMDFAAKLGRMVEECHRLGLHRTAHRLHDAEREIGWEITNTPMPESERKRMYCQTDGVK